MAKLIELTFYVSYIVLVFILFMLLCSFTAGLAAEIYHNTRINIRRRRNAKEFKSFCSKLPITTPEKDFIHFTKDDLKKNPIIIRNENESFKVGE